jgi:lipoyl(octanoyl) transferase
MLLERVVHPLDQLVVRRFDIMPYEPVWRAMQKHTQQRDGNSPDEVWILQHEPVFTLGQAGKAEHVLSPGAIPLIRADRGGQVTYHGPGQLVVYILVALPRLKIGARDLVSAIEQSVIATLASYGITAVVKAGAPGVYVAGAKIASLGLRIRKGSSYHGLALNVAMDLEPFLRINPCGYAGLRMVQLRDLMAAASLADTAGIWLEHFKVGMGYHHLTEKKGLPNYE